MLAAAGRTQKQPKWPPGYGEEGIVMFGSILSLGMLYLTEYYPAL